jgi:hypothetical protein
MNTPEDGPNGHLLQEDTDDEMDWEEVDVPEQQHNLEITLNFRKKEDVAEKSLCF